MIWRETPYDKTLKAVSEVVSDVSFLSLCARITEIVHPNSKAVLYHR